MKKKPSYAVYFAGELFSAKHLIGNAYLAEAIFEKSHGHFQCLLPQNIEHRSLSAQSVRDRNLRTLAACDLALFNFDGPELDAGTVVEFMFAKFADIPAVLLRSDPRRRSPAPGGSWNLMCSFYPRTEHVILDSLGLYRKFTQQRRLRLVDMHLLAGQHSSAAAQAACEVIAAHVVRALARVLRKEPVMPKYVRAEVYNWLALLPGLRGPAKKLRKEFEQILERKVDRDLL
jgi:nucleoside 2-deoxyribosyltransferase